VYANPEFERISGLGVSALERQFWDILEGDAVDEPSGLSGNGGAKVDHGSGVVVALRAV